MGLELRRWMKYARARLDAVVGKGHEELDRLEAEREADQADKPWLGAEGEAPSLDEARARIAWEADQQRRRAERLAADGAADGATGGESQASAADATLPSPGGSAATPTPQGSDDVTADTPAQGRTGTDAGSPAPRGPEDVAADAAAASARLDLEAREREAAARLDAIREELGIDAPGGDDADDVS